MIHSSKKRAKLLACFTVFALIISLVPLHTAASPTDIEGHWAEEQVQGWLEEGLAEGYPDGTFRTDSTVTRAEFVAFMNRAYETPDPSEDADFTDISQEDWYFDEVSAAVEAGYVSGYPDGTFQPGSDITRQEAAAILVRLLHLEPGEAEEFEDADKISGWAKESVEAASTAGLMSGYPDGTFKPQSPITRAETIVFLDRGLDLVEAEDKKEDIEEDIEEEDETEPKFKVTYNVEGSSGKIEGKVDNKSIDSGDKLEKGKDINFTAEPEEGYGVKEWIIDGSVQAGETGQTFKLKNLESDVEVKVKFQLIDLAIEDTSIVDSKTIEVSFNDGASEKIKNFEPTPLQVGANDITFTYKDEEFNVEVDYKGKNYINEIDSEYLQFMSLHTIYIEVTRDVFAVTVNDMNMHYEGENKFSLATTKLNRGAEITVNVYDRYGSLIQIKETKL